jgi:dihydrolipoamide dehydrogenase
VAEGYECVVVGAGPGGYVAAIRASQLGLRTAVVERNRVGGRCLNEACIPAKAMLRVADVRDLVARASDFGLQTSEPKLDFAKAAARRDQVIGGLTDGVALLLKRHRVDVLEGAARISKRGVQVDSTELETERIILACGSVPQPILDVPFGERVLDTAATWLLGELPGSLCVIGAGPSGVEVASAFARLGTRVRLLESLVQILPREDPDTASVCARELANSGVEITTGAALTEIKPGAKAVAVEFNGQREEFDFVCIAAGRRADVGALELDDGDLALDDAGLIHVDGRMRTSRDGIWAIGDLVRGPALAHKASEEGVIAAEDAAGLATHPLDYSSIPAVTFSHPQVASFGLTQAAAEEEAEVVIGKVPLRSVGAPSVLGEETGLVKLVGNASTGEILGAHICAVNAAELIAEIKGARDYEAGFSDLARSVHAHPTVSEAVLEAARAADGWLIHG